MIRFFIGALIGICAGYTLARLIPVWLFLSLCLTLFVLAVFLFWLLHLGVNDFQEY